MKNALWVVALLLLLSFGCKEDESKPFDPLTDSPAETIVSDEKTNSNAADSSNETAVGDDQTTTVTDDSFTEMVVGVEQAHAISIDFSPGYIQEEYYTSSRSVTLGIAGIDYLKFSKYFNGPLGSYNMQHYQLISTLENCELCARDSKPAVFKLNDTVQVTDTFMPFNRADLSTSPGDNNYVVFKFGNDKKYMGWLKITSSGSRLEFSKCSYYELKVQ